MPFGEELGAGVGRGHRGHLTDFQFPDRDFHFRERSFDLTLSDHTYAAQPAMLTLF
jgi:hypothetical protein